MIHFHIRVLGDVYHSLKKHREAEDCYQNALKQNSRMGRAYFGLGLAQSAQGKYVEAVENYKKILEVEVGPEARVRGNLAYAYYALGRIDEAIEEYKKAIGLDPFNF